MEINGNQWLPGMVEEIAYFQTQSACKVYMMYTYGAKTDENSRSWHYAFYVWIHGSLNEYNIEQIIKLYSGRTSII